GFRLSVLSFTQKNKTSARLIIPAKVLEEIQRIAESLKVSSITFTVSQELKQVFFSFDEVEVFARLIDGEYPPYQKIIPESFSTEIVTSASSLQEELKRALIFSRESNIIQLHFSSEELKVAASSPGSGTYEGVISDASVSGEEGSIAFNAKYLLDYLQNFKEDSITISLKGNQKAAVFKTSTVPELLYLVMPFRINQ
ncbi:MAG: polymerase subunit beta, partial [Patescibacteria group bacterium]|nr:polymerase subunit beta [Patescibacteria group bacterium]